MADRSPVDTAEMRRLWQPGTQLDPSGPTATVFRMLDEIDALRAKLAESEAACAVLAKSLERACHSERECANAPCKTHRLLGSLPSSVRAHMEEDAALRDLERAARKQMELFEDAVRSARMDSPDPLDHYERIYKPAIAHLDAVRAKGGG